VAAVAAAAAAAAALMLLHAASNQSRPEPASHWYDEYTSIRLPSALATTTEIKSFL
jgi:hypothetical protein